MTFTQPWLGIDESHLANFNQWQLHTQAMAPFQAMQEAAKKDGVDMTIASSFRSFARQQAIWDAKWQGKRVLNNIDSQPLDSNKLSDIEKLHAILLWSALPGLSRHHWGSDLDVYDAVQCEANGHKLALITDEYSQGGPCYTLNLWLDAHAAEYGFYRPYQGYLGGVAPEPWHISYRPVASKMLEGIQLKQLEQVLIRHQVQGHKTIIPHLEDIYLRYAVQGVSP